MYRKKIRELRHKKGLRLKDLAQLSGIGASTIGDLELQKHDTSVTILIKLCLALDISPNELLNYEKLKYYYENGYEDDFKKW